MPFLIFHNVSTAVTAQNVYRPHVEGARSRTRIMIVFQDFLPTVSLAFFRRISSKFKANWSPYCSSLRMLLLNPSELDVNVNPSTELQTNNYCADNLTAVFVRLFNYFVQSSICTENKFKCSRFDSVLYVKGKVRKRQLLT